MAAVWCIKAFDGQWCATFRGHAPSVDARADRTACGTYIYSLPVGSERRMPTCPDCRQRVQRRRAKPARATKGRVR